MTYQYWLLVLCIKGWVIKLPVKLYVRYLRFLTFFNPKHDFLRFWVVAHVFSNSEPPPITCLQDHPWDLHKTDDIVLGITPPQIHPVTRFKTIITQKCYAYMIIRIFKLCFFLPASWKKLNVTSRWILVWMTIVAFNLPTRKHNNRIKYRSHTTICAKMKLLPVFERHLEFRDEEIIVDGMVTAEKFTLENVGITFVILSLGGTEPEIHLGG